MKHLFAGNPMMAEVLREKNKALAPESWRGGQLAARILLGVFYLLGLALVLNNIQYIEPVILLYVLMGVQTLLIPAVLHATIAGEREKRSLDMLLVAPVTASQIVIGKFSRALVPVVALSLAIGLPTLAVELARSADGAERYDLNRPGMLGFMIASLFCLLFAMAIGGLTMWISSKTRTASAAMMSTIGALFLLLIVVPAIAATMSYGAGDFADFVIEMNPFISLYSAYMGPSEQGAFSVSSGEYTLLAMILYAVCTVVTLWLATNNVHKLARTGGSQ
ncbi:MAG: ABC transporter permease subunit [Armatimonadetes bacterium]|nr:ABC transporter permease subunit [Armatimonadota bacterium]